MVTVKNISFCTEKSLVLDDLSFHVKKGEFIAIVGPSGSGKTALLRILAGLLRPTSGAVTWKTPVEKSFVFQTPGLLPWLPVIENVLLPLTLKDKKPSKNHQKAIQLLHAVGLQGKETWQVHQLSEGQKQRVSLARSLITTPEVICMDEPFASLDAMTREKLQQTLITIAFQFKPTILFVTHSISEAVLLADRIFILDGPPTHIKEILTLPEKKRDDILLASKSISETIASIRKKVLFLWANSDNKIQELPPPIQEKPWSGNTSSFFVVAVFVSFLWSIQSLFAIPEYLFPSFTTTLSTTIQWLRTGILLQYTTETILATLGGLALAIPVALCFGFLSARYKHISRILTPLIVGIQVIPIIAYAPLLILWFGLGIVTKMYTAALIAFFPLYNNTLTGILAAEQYIIDVKKLYDVSNWKSFWVIDIPQAMTYVIGGLHVSVAFALVGAVVGEFVGGNQGIGHLIALSRSNADTAGVFVCVLVLWGIGTVLTSAVSLLKNILNISSYYKESTL